jgi:hypothetical protein
MYNQCDPFIYLNLIVKNREVPIERYLVGQYQISMSPVSKLLIY